MKNADGVHLLLAALGLTTLALGALWPKKVTVTRAGSASAASAAVRVKQSPRVWQLDPKRWVPTLATYCPGPECTIEKKARRACEARPGGVFSVEPDFVCKLDDGVHRMVCDDIDDDRQCGMLAHSDREYAQYEFQRYWREGEKMFTDVDLDADRREGKLVCTESERSVACSFTERSTGREHPDSPIVCNWMGCGFPFAESAD